MSKKSFTLVIIILLVLTSTASIGQGINSSFSASIDSKTLYVGGEGADNYSTIQTAIFFADEGDTVFVYDDSSPYKESIVINKAITLQGENKSTTIIDGNKNQDVILCESDNVQINGFTIINCTTNNGHWWIAGIQLQYNRNCIVSNNIVISNQHGIRCYYSTNNTISNNFIKSNENSGIWLNQQSNNNTITSNVINSNGYCGVNIDNSDYDTVEYNIINYNGGDGVILDDSNFAEVVRNNLTDNNYNGIMLRSSCNNKIFNNHLIKNGLLIWQTFSANNKVENNTVDNKQLVYWTNIEDRTIDDAGQIILIDCNNITIKNLEISDIFFAIQLLDPNDCIITNNILNNNYRGIYIQNSYQKTSKKISISNNILSNNEDGMYIDYSSDYLIENNIIQNNTNIGLRISGKYHTVCKNIFNNNYEGIYIRGLRNNVYKNVLTNNNKNGIFCEDLHKSIIHKNDINNNKNGIYIIDSKNNIISRNNIYKNKGLNAFFKDSLINLWFRNFWNKYLGPKFIGGLKYIIVGTWSPPYILPVINFDLLPKKQRYDILPLL